MNRLLFALFFLLIVNYLRAQEIPARPQYYTPVYDEVSLLTETEKKQLSERLIKYEDSTSTQIQIVIIDNLKGYSEMVFANKWANEWGIGQKGSNNGLLIFIAKSDRKIRIEVGYGLEDKITDINAANIINKTIKPFFKSENYYLGLNNAVSDIESYLSGFYNNNQRNKIEEIVYPKRKWYQIGFEGIFNLLIMFAFIFIFNYLVYVDYKNSQKSSIYPISWVFLVFGNALMFAYTFFYGIEVDPEKPDLVFHFLVGVLPSIFVNKYKKWFKTAKEAYNRISIFLLVWGASTLLLTFVIDDKFHDFKTFLPFVLYGFFTTIVLYIFYPVMLHTLTAPAGSGNSISYKSSGYKSSSYKSSSYKSSSYKSSSYSSSSSKSSYGGGSFGGGGASGSW